MGWQIVMIGIGLVGCSLIVTIDSWLDLASNPGFCTTLALAQTGPGNNTSVPQIYNLTTVIQCDRNIFGSIVAFGLQPLACGLRPMAYGLRPTAYGLRPTAYGLRPPLCAKFVPRISVDHWVRGVWAYYCGSVACVLA